MSKSQDIKSIVIPVHGFTPSGGNRVLIKLANEWIAMGISVDFLVNDSSMPFFPTNARILRTSGSKFIIKLFYRVNIVFGIINLAKALKKKGGNYDLVIASHSFTAISCYLSGYGAKTVYYIQGYDPEIFEKKDKLSSKIAALISRTSYLLCRKQIVNSKHYLKYKLINSEFVIPPGLDLSIFKSKKNPGCILEKEIKVGIIGRQESYKVRPVLNFYRSLRKVSVNTKLVIAFGNIQSSDLIGLGNYEFVLPKNDEELSLFYRSCDIFLALSEFKEGAFYPVLEALASGTSLVTNNFYKADNSNCWIINDENNVDNLVVTLLNNDHLRVERAKQGIEDIKNIDWKTLAPLFIRYSICLL